VRELSGPRDALIFIGRRIWRIAPLLYALTAAYVGVELLYGYSRDPAAILNCFTILPLFHSTSHYQYELIPAWTLGFEMTFYLIVAAVVAAGVTKRLPVLIVAVLLLPLLALDAMMIEFAFGVAAYWVWSLGLVQRRHVAPLLIVAVVIFVAAWGTPRQIGWGIPAALAFSAALMWQPKTKWLLWLGDISYSLYLSHVVTFDALAPLLSPFGALAMIAPLAVSGLVIAWLVYEAVERPLLHMAIYRRQRAQMMVMRPTPVAPLPPATANIREHSQRIRRR
jgi:peptidoglycan/LPS O-acetylase OafA/YrhL